MNRNEKGQFVKTHGHWVGNRKHFLWDTWRGMRCRCLNPKNKDFPNYGGRGIFICERWLDFGKFVEDMLPEWKKGLTLGRIDNNGNYSPSNCRWESMEQQNNNRRDNREIEYHGLILTAADWSKVIGISQGVFNNRLSRNVPIEKLMDPLVRRSPQITLHGKSKRITEWSRELGINPQTIRYRLKRGYEVDLVLSKDFPHVETKKL
jgi:hypothetical protein